MKVSEERRATQKVAKRGVKVHGIIIEVLATIIVIATIALSFYACRNMHYDEKPLKKTYKVGYEEKQVTLDDGTVLNLGRLN
ncbi:MAG: alpha/beta hydrolase superfamily [Herbinix sp.]|jgi:heme oxygenase|nr:alpha/beta hydrolase superfamily [Herbinix sp.]